MGQGQTEIGTIYVNYSAAENAIRAMSDEQARALVERFDHNVRDDMPPVHQASSLAMKEFSDKTHSPLIVRIGRPTLFDRDPKARQVMDAFMVKIENETDGYAFVDDPAFCTALVGGADEIASIAHDLPDTESFWTIVRALNHNNPFEFSDEYSGDVGHVLEQTLVEHSIEDQHADTLRYLPRTPFDSSHGFVSVEAFDAEVKAKKRERNCVNRARDTWLERFGQACGPFSIQKSLASFRETGNAFYWTSQASAPKERLNEAVRMQEASAALSKARPISKGNAEVYQEFKQSEIDSGHSPFGYWFSPDGSVFPMLSFQDHDRWIRQHLAGKEREGRTEALASGWVSLTMATEFNADPNIGYNPASDCSKALKAAARIVRRGGDYAAMVVEAYDDSYTTLSYEQIDDTKQGVRRLNELSREVGENYVAPPKP